MSDPVREQLVEKFVESVVGVAGRAVDTDALRYSMREAVNDGSLVQKTATYEYPDLNNARWPIKALRDAAMTLHLYDTDGPEAAMLFKLSQV